MDRLKTTAEERARLRFRAEHDDDPVMVRSTPLVAILDDLDTLLAENEGLSGVVRAARAEFARQCAIEPDENAKLRHHYDAAAPEHNLLALLDLYEDRRLAAAAEVERLRGLVRWFLNGDDHTHEDDCGAWGNHDLDVCRNTRPCGDDTCDGPHCTCEATMMRDRAREALAAMEAP